MGCKTRFDVTRVEHVDQTVVLTVLTHNDRLSGSAHLAFHLTHNQVSLMTI
jgi:hypothetical protein